MEKTSHLNLEEVLIESKTNPDKCISDLIEEVKNLRNHALKREEKYKHELHKKKSKIQDLQHKVDKYTKMLASFNQILIQNGFGSQNGHAQHESKHFDR
jgi:vacuolar-type H+-ATPase subunit I/STV1